VTGQGRIELPSHAEVVVVGAGLAGLAAAATLRAAGRDVHVIEASNGVGGRVRTDIVDGFQLDRGFQILLTAYPEVSRQLDVAALRLQTFDPGALVMIDGTGHRMVDPLRSPTAIVGTVAAPVGSLADKLRVARLRWHVTRTPVPQLLRGDDVSTLDGLRQDGFSQTMIDRFFRPLFAGIQLDPELTTSRRMFDAIFSSLARGDAAIPAAGMQAIPNQLAAKVEAERLHLGVAAASLDGTSVHTAEGRVDAASVIVATEGPAAARLLGLAPVGSNPVTCVWFAAERPPVKDKLIVLDGSGHGPALNVAIHSNVATSYAPEGQALIAAACPGVADPDIEPLVRRQLAGWWGSDVSAWRHLRTDTIAHGQPTQRVPFAPKRQVALGGGVFVCGDHRDTASIQGALFSGRRCAEAVLTQTS
jgi:phytoene dehydrogenase-like protein